MDVYARLVIVKRGFTCSYSKFLEVCLEFSVLPLVNFVELLQSGLESGALFRLFAQLNIEVVDGGVQCLTLLVQTLNLEQ